MNQRLKLSPDDVVFQRQANGTWYSLREWSPLHDGTDKLGDHTDAEVADWPDLVAVATLAPPVDPDRMVAEIVAVANKDVDPLLTAFLPALRVDYRQGTPGEWNVSVCIAPRGQTPSFARVTDSSLLTALVKLHAKVVTGDA